MVGSVPISEKYSLTIAEACEYFNIGDKKLRRIISENIDSGLYIQNGAKTLIKRKKFEDYLNSLTSI